MKRPLKIIIIVGARPNFMKAAPIVRRIQRHHGESCTDGISLNCRLIHTGQHYDFNMSEVFFEELGIPKPDINLEVGSGSQAAQTANIIAKFAPVCEQERPDWVVVLGDVNSTMACTLVCAKLGVKVAHVEAGLRSFDRSMPEEINRIVTDALADLLLTPSTDANENLVREGIPISKIKFVGNVMIDTLLANLERARASSILDNLGLEHDHFVYVTVHRPSNVDTRDRLLALMTELHKIKRYLPVVLPMHPRTRKMCAEYSIPLPEDADFRIIDPLGYHDSLRLTDAAKLVLTDSGGLQEESTFLRTPCLTLRPNTERPVTLTIGTNRLTTLDRIEGDIAHVLETRGKSGQIPPLWDGRTAERVVDCIVAATLEGQERNAPHDLHT